MHCRIELLKKFFVLPLALLTSEAKWVLSEFQIRK
jgi:hypothetical protein